VSSSQAETIIRLLHSLDIILVIGIAVIGLLLFFLLIYGRRG
jgi:hypothetical protein